MSKSGRHGRWGLSKRRRLLAGPYFRPETLWTERRVLLRCVDEGVMTPSPNGVRRTLTPLVDGVEEFELCWPTGWMISNSVGQQGASVMNVHAFR